MATARRDFLRQLTDAESAGEEDRRTIDKIATVPQTVSAAELNRPPGVRFANGQQAFDLSYAATIEGLKRQVVTMRKMNRSDASILASFMTAKVKDFKTLRRISTAN